MRWLSPAVLLVFAAPALAQGVETDAPPAPDIPVDSLTLDNAPFRQDIKISCNFITECVEDEPCTEVEFTPEITGNAGGLTPDDLVVQSEMVTDAETIELLGVKSGKSYSLSGGTFAARHLLSITNGGATRYTVHYAEGPFVISYLGTCN
jgi:hypothetical protein